MCYFICAKDKLLQLQLQVITFLKGQLRPSNKLDLTKKRLFVKIKLQRKVRQFSFVISQLKKTFPTK
jgi:hypothetical protein